MKLFRALTLLAIVVPSLAGCAAHGSSLVLDAVGPAPKSKESVSGRGTLEVFSAFETFNSSGSRFDDVQRHSSYRVFTQDGTLLRVIQNHAGPFEDAPETVELAPGAYQVTARANGYGFVTVPVVIAEHRTTTVHLEASSPGGEVSGSDSVRLPGGVVVGWKAKGSAGSIP